MRRLYLRILGALLATAMLSFGAFLGVFVRVTAPAVERLVRGVQELTLEEAVDALNEGGANRAAARLESRKVFTNATHYLTDATGRDLVTGADRSELLAKDPRGTGIRVAVGGRRVMVRVSEDGRYRLITLATPPFGFLDILPYYALLLVAIAVLCWVLAIDIVAPLRKMAGVVEEFGRGGLSARTGVTRRDEIGDLARAVDGMAQRIELLVSAERRLLQDVSHELRSPLTRLNLNLELSRTMPDREAAASRLQRDVDRLSRLVGSLLEVTRLEGEDLHATSAPVDVAALVAEVVADCAFEARSRDVRIAVAPGHAVILGDAELLRRAIENVVRNAARYAPPDSTVDVQVEADHESVMVTVRDTGPGVPEEVLDRLGTPFFRAGSARDPDSGGVGLGLAIARRAIERHGGQWTVENAWPGLRVRMAIRARCSESQSS